MDLNVAAHARLALLLLVAFHPSMPQLDLLEVLLDQRPPYASADSCLAALAFVVLDCVVLLPSDVLEVRLDAVECRQDTVSVTGPNSSSSC